MLTKKQLKIRKELYELFPGVDEYALNDVLEANRYDLLRSAKNLFPLHIDRQADVHTSQSVFPSSKQAIEAPEQYWKSVRS